MIAGFAAAMVRGMAMPDALRFATAVSASNAMHAGTGCIDPSQLDELQAQSRVLRL
jgi:fructose-1-phosphate kinase PfkB-like protein